MPAGPHILGLSAYYHDSAACLVRSGCVLAAAQEERFSRTKNDSRFPQHAVAFCLRQGGVAPADLDAVVFYDKPIRKFSRLLETYLAVAPRGWRTFLAFLPAWFQEKLDLRRTIRRAMPGLRRDCPVLFTAHHRAHAASAFYPSPFSEAAILTVDGVGEWATTTLGVGHGSRIELLEEMQFPHSLGLLYSAFTDYCGFRINSGEYKLMGLAPYGKPCYVDRILGTLMDLKADGSFWLDLDYFDFLHGSTMANGRFHDLFGGPPRTPDQPIEPRHMDVARSIQAVTEEVMLRLARRARERTGLDCLCLAGGVALNCVANGRILRERVFRRIWIQPAAGDAGGALGAALAAWHERWPGQAVRSNSEAVEDGMGGALLGPEFTDDEIEVVLTSHGAVYERLAFGDLLDRVVTLLQAGRVVGWFQGRMEFGPRALGNRSILGDPRSSTMQSVLNLKVKFRESFRPFAPVVREHRAAEYFELEGVSPYMLLVAPVRESLRRPVPEGLSGLELLRSRRSEIPAVTHVDYSARIQTVHARHNAKLDQLLERWEQATGCGVLVNTSFNVRGEPVVCTPDDAYRCFVNTEMDDLALGSCLLARSAQPQRPIPRRGTLQPD